MMIFYRSSPLYHSAYTITNTLVMGVLPIGIKLASEWRKSLLIDFINENEDMEYPQLSKLKMYTYLLVCHAIKHAW